MKGGGVIALILILISSDITAVVNGWSFHSVSELMLLDGDTFKLDPYENIPNVSDQGYKLAF